MSPQGVIVAGHRIYQVCSACGKLVQINKRILGSMHVCVNQEDWFVEF